MAEDRLPNVELPPVLWRKMMRAAKRAKPKTNGKALVALACEEFLKAEKANK